MSASDNICVLATISSVFRIAILANARFAYFADPTTVSASALASAGAVSSNIFMVGVVSAGAGVNIYADIKIGDRVVSPDKILKLIRLIMLCLGLTMCIGWCTLGVWNGEYYYRVFRRGTYLLSIFGCLFISLPVMNFFGNKVIGMLMVKKANPSEMSTNGNGKATMHSKIEESGRANTNSKIEDGNGSRHKSVSSRMRQATSVVKRKRTADEKIANFKWAINMCIWLLYVLTIFNNACLLLGFEVPAIQNSLIGLVIVKVLGDSSVWVSCSFIWLYLYRVQ
ncbi:hypothetical protein HDV06_003548 [Boothiomyces sp. JEL0866]|nr:hypothetical protein HDV06_003548 [Boothiomyces sp. JEL0866]